MHFFVAVVLAGTAGTVDLKQYIQSSDSLIRARAAYVFARSTDMDSSSNVLGVRKRMRTAPPEVRAATIRGLGYRFYSKEAPQWVRETVASALNDEDPGVAQAAAESIALQGWPMAEKALIKALDRQKSKPGSRAHRQALLLSAGRLGTPALSKSVTDLYDANSGGQRGFPFRATPSGAFLAAAADLGQARAENVVDGFYDVINDGADAPIISTATDTFLERGQVRILIGSSDTMKIWTARAALVMRPPSPSFSFLGAYLESHFISNRIEAAAALASVPGKIRADALAALRSRSEDQSGKVRAIVVRTLAASGQHAAVLVGALDDPFPDLRAEAAMGIAEAGATQTHRKALTTALAKEKDPIARAALQAALSSK